MYNNLAPIILIAYNRPWHTEQVLQALKRNELADQSDLFIYLDGAKDSASADEIELINQVEEIVRREQWCKKVEIIISEKNQGCRWAPIHAITDTLAQHDSVIILEDDIVTSPYFLRYMNDALNYYKNYSSVFSISGYNLPANMLPIPNDYKYDVYVSYRQLNWGWGTWRNRWEQVDWDKNFIPIFLSDKFQVAAFNRGGDDLSQMLKAEFYKKSDAWDIQFSFAQFKYHAVSIIPCHSYTNNIGLDSSGTHTMNKNLDKWNNNLNLCQKNPLLLDVIYTDKRIVNSFHNVFCSKKRPLWQKIINKLTSIFINKKFFVIKKKIYN